MPPKTTPTKLSTVVPSASELEAARAILASADAKAMASKKASMKHFLSLHPDEQASLAKGKNKNEFLEKFLVHMARSNNATKVAENRKTVVSRSAKHLDLHWWSMETMDQKLGVEKATHWRQSGKIVSKPDSLTGSRHEKHVEWGVPKNWERITEDELRELMVACQAELDNADEIDAMKVLAPTMHGASSGANDPKIKEEPAKTKKELLGERCQELMKNRKGALQRFQEQLLEMKMIISKSESAEANAKGKLVLIL